MVTFETVAAFAAGLAIGLVIFAFWRLTAEKRLRRDAIRRSAAVIAGRVTEQLVPYLPGFEFDPRDARFLGSPVDLVVFDGLSTGAVTRVVFLEIKTGTATLTAREKEVRDAIQHRRVEWRELLVTRAAPQDGG